MILIDGSSCAPVLTVKYITSAYMALHAEGLAGIELHYTTKLSVEQVQLSTSCTCIFLQNLYTIGKIYKRVPSETSEPGKTNNVSIDTPTFELICVTYPQTPSIAIKLWVALQIIDIFLCNVNNIRKLNSTTYSCENRAKVLGNSIPVRLCISLETCSLVPRPSQTQGGGGGLVSFLT